MCLLDVSDCLTIAIITSYNWHTMRKVFPMMCDGVHMVVLRYAYDCHMACLCSPFDFPMVGL